MSRVTHDAGQLGHAVGKAHSLVEVLPQEFADAGLGADGRVDPGIAAVLVGADRDQVAILLDRKSVV